MDPVNILGIARSAALAAEDATEIRKVLYAFFSKTEHADQTICGFILEVEAFGSACEALHKRLQDIAGEHDSKVANGGLAKTRLWTCVELQVRDGRKTIGELRSALYTFPNNRGQIKLNTDAKDIDELRNRVRSHTASLQMLMHTMAIALASKGDRELQTLLEKVEECGIRLKALRTVSIRKDVERYNHEEEIIVLGEATLSAAYESLHSAGLAEGSLNNDTDRALHSHSWLQDVKKNEMTKNRFSANSKTDWPSVTSDRPSVMFTDHEFSIIGTPPTNAIGKHPKDMAESSLIQCASEGKDKDKLIVDSAREALERGRSSFQANDFKAASESLQRASRIIRELPKHQQGKVCNTWDLRYLLSVCAYYKEDLANAKSQLWSVVEYASRVPLQTKKQRKQYCVAGHLLSIVCVELGRLEEARQYCQSVYDARNKLYRRTHPECLRSLALLTRIFHLLGQTQKSEVYSRLLPEADRGSYLKIFENLGLRRSLPTPILQNALLLPLTQNFYLDAGPTVIRKQLTDKVATASGNKSLAISLRWNPVTFLNQQFRHLKRISTALVYCGSPREPFVTTTKDYLHTNWPTVAEALLDCVERLCAQAEGCCVHGTVHDVIVEHADITVELEDEITYLNIWGQEAVILDLAEAFVWMSVACRENDGKQRVGTTSALLHPYANEAMDFHVEYICADLDQGEDAIGYCWIGMVHNPVVATGYPTPPRQHSEQGLELDFEVMLALSRTDWAARVGTTLLIKGVISALVPVLDTGVSIIWHFVLNKDSSRLSYDQIPSHPSLPHLTLREIDHRRHFVGMWTTSAQVLAGTDDQALYNFEKSKSSSIDHYTVTLSNLGMSLGKLLTVSADITLAKKDIAPPFRSSEGQWYERQIVDASSVTVLCYGQEDRRGWLLDGASALMHISRAWLTYHRYARLIPPEVLGQLRYVEGPGGKNAAIDALIENKRRNICIFTEEERKWVRTQPREREVEATSPRADLLTDSSHEPQGDLRQECKIVTSEYTFKHLVVEFWRILEDMSDKLRVAKFTQPGVALKPWTNRPILVGWEICDVLSLKGPFEPRTVKLEPNGKDWLSYARESSSVVLLARTFGDLIKPSIITTGDCWRDSNMPPGKDYLAVPLDLWRESAMLDKSGDYSCGYVKLTDHTYWHGFDPSCDACTCSTSQYCSVVSRLGHKHATEKLRSAEALLPIGVFDRFPQGATIIGQSKKLQKRRLRSPDVAATHLRNMALKHKREFDRISPTDLGVVHTESSLSILDHSVSNDSTLAQQKSSMTLEALESYATPVTSKDLIASIQFSEPVKPPQLLAGEETPRKTVAQITEMDALGSGGCRTGEGPMESFSTRHQPKGNISLWKKVKSFIRSG